MDAFVLTEAERRFIVELDARGVRFMVVGLTAAALQGANTTTVDIDLWFESTADPRIAEAATQAGGMFISGFGMMPVEGVTFQMLALDRILASKRAANRPKDQAAIPALEEALAALDSE